MHRYQLQFVFVVSLFLVACSTPQIETQQEQVHYSENTIEIVQVREDQFIGSPEGKNKPPYMSSPIKDFKNIVISGIYKSPYHGYELAVPLVFGSYKISVHQALVSKRPDGTPITSHVLFIPQKGSGVAALVVTRLREDRPKDAASVLRRFKPQSEQEEQALEKQGILYKSYQGKHGEILEREIKNRLFSDYFPYRVHTDRSSEMKSLGISRFFVVGDYFYEFTVLLLRSSVVKEGESFHDVAQRQLDVLTTGIIKYAD
ncbi:hypothetical protein [Desulforhopalus sp. 52FAK]